MAEAEASHGVERQPVSRNRSKVNLIKHKQNDGNDTSRFESSASEIPDDMIKDEYKELSDVINHLKVVG